MSTHRSSWKRRERDAARLFGSKRKVLSGSAGRDDQTCSDSDHPKLFIESKLRAVSSVRSRWEKARDRARREGKVPVVALYAKHRPGALIVVHESDLQAVAAALAAAPGPGQAPDPSPWIQDREPFHP
jgi:hypothetical protein